MTDNPTLQSEKLEPCPFCPHGVGFVRNESGRYNGVIWIECDWPSHAVRLVAGDDAAPPCGARTAEYQTEQEAINAWNSRAPVVAPREDVVQVLTDLRGHFGPSNCWCDAEGDAPHLYCCTAARELVKRLSATPSPPYSPVPEQEDPHPGYDCGGTCVVHRFALPAATPAPVIHPFGPCGYKYCDWPDGELRCNEARSICPSVAREAAEEIAALEKPNHTNTAFEVAHCDICTAYRQRIVAIIKRHRSPVSAAGGDEVHCWHCGIELEPVETRPRCDECSADCDVEMCTAFGCAPRSSTVAADSVGEEGE